MNTWYAFVAILFSIAIIVPPQKNMGAKGFMKNWDSHIEKPAKRLSPPKLIRARYNINSTPINIITYLTFLVDFIDWILCITLLPCLLFLRDESLDVAILIYILLFIVINFPIGIVRTICCIKISKKKKFKMHTDEYSAIESLGKIIEYEHSSEHREAMQKHKEYTEIISPFLKVFNRCLDKERGVKYISEESLKWLIDKITPKYEKYLSYDISEELHKKSVLTIRVIRDNRIVTQVPIKTNKKKHNS